MKEKRKFSFDTFYKIYVITFLFIYVIIFLQGCGSIKVNALDNNNYEYVTQFKDNENGYVILEYNNNLYAITSNNKNCEFYYSFSSQSINVGSKNGNSLNFGDKVTLYKYSEENKTWDNVQENNEHVIISGISKVNFLDSSSSVYKYDGETFENVVFQQVGQQGIVRLFNKSYINLGTILKEVKSLVPLVLVFIILIISFYKGLSFLQKMLKI